MSSLRCEFCAIRLDTGHNVGDCVIQYSYYWMCGDCRKRDPLWNKEIETRAKWRARKENIHWIQLVHATQKEMLQEFKVEESELWI